MKKISFTALLFAVLFAFTTGVAVGAPPEQSNGKGVPPTKYDFIEEFGGPLTFEFPLLDCGDFGATLSSTYAGFWVYHPARKGRGEFEFYQSHLRHTISNDDDPSIYVEGIPGSHMTRHWAGAPFASDPIETGVQLMITLPGYGVVMRDVGRIRIDWDTFEAVFIAGEWQSGVTPAMTSDPDYMALCEALSP